MIFSDIPLNQYLGITEVEGPSSYLLQMPDSETLHNHIGTIHAAALFGLIEATSAHFLQKVFYKIEDQVIPLVRKVEVKYSKPASGTVYSKATLIDVLAMDIEKQFKEKKRVLVPVKVELFLADFTRISSARVEWFFGW